MLTENSTVKQKKKEKSYCGIKIDFLEKNLKSLKERENNMTTNMTTKEIKELALQILNRNGETGIKKSDFTVKQAKQLINEYNLGWMK